ncbi:hypothetical protein KBD45_00150 [Candidatus Dojkabacteria bacterium]|nr:hypothetical protein [Candidatus Dojkabacteria bacterium]
MLNLIVFVAVAFLIIFLSYILFPASINKNKRFDILIFFLITFVFIGRVLELAFIKDLSSVGWSLLPITEDSQNINYFSKFPWIFFNLSQTIYIWFWILFRFFISVILIKIFFKIAAKEFKEVRATLFYVVFVVISLFSIWFDSTTSVTYIIKGYSLSLSIASAILFFIYLYYKFFKKSTLSITWGLIIIFSINLYFLLIYPDKLESNKYIIEIFASIILLIVENNKEISKFLFRSKGEQSKLSRTFIARNQYSEKNKRNWISEINSKYKKN